MPSRVLASVIVAAVVHAGASARQSPPPVTSAFELATPTGPLAGTLVMPAATGRVPVALIIAGSGPTDRDGNSAMLPGRNDAYRLLAESLAAAGIASVRYDKRGVAASAVAGRSEADMRFDTLVEDAAAWIAKLRNDFRFTTITVIGHSEGSLVGLLAARAARADAFVSIAGAGRPAADVIRQQLRTQLQSDPALLQAAEAILTALEAGRTVAQVPQPLAALFRPSVQPYLISWIRYAPATELARLKIPQLILQGTTDMQIPVTDAQALKAASPEAELRVIEGMNHVMKTVTEPARQAASYIDPGLPLASDLVPAITGFIRRLETPGRPTVRRPTVERRSLRGVTMAEIDGARVAIEYGRPSKRERAIWGALVPWGRWWMPGADEASTLTTSHALRVGSLDVPAGDYTIYTLPREEAFTLVVNEATNVFHTVYDPSRDLGHVPMTRTMLSGTPVEQLTFAILPRSGGGGTLELIWDDRKYAVEVRRP